MSNHSVIEHRANMYYVEFREDYLLISQNCIYKKNNTEKTKCKATPYCKALILAVLESWTNDKRGKGQDLGIYMTYPQWMESMYGMFGRTAIIDSLDELIGEGLVSREAHRMYGKDTYKYYLNYNEVNQRLKTLEAREPNTTRPLVDASTSKRVASTSKPVTRPQVDEDPSTSGHNIDTTNNLNLKTTESVVTADADANDTPALPEKTQETPAEQPQEKKRATRKPRAKKFEIAAELQDRVKMVYEHLDAWRQEITGDPEEHFSHDVESDQSICSLFDGKPPTHKKLKQVCNDLWNEPRNTRSGYWAREHMTIPFICKQYKAKSILLAASDKKPQEQQPTSYSVGGYTYNPEQEIDAPELKFVGPYRNRKRKGA